MSDADNKTGKMERIRLDELAKLEDTGKVVLKANEALALHEMRRMLERQAERDLVIEEMHTVVDTLVAGHVLLSDEVKKLKSAHGVLLRHQTELYERQNVIAAVCDVFAEKLEEDTKAREKLATELSDRD
jgi:hypothetical protein